MTEIKPSFAARVQDLDEPTSPQDIEDEPECQHHWAKFYIVAMAKRLYHQEEQLPKFFKHAASGHYVHDKIALSFFLDRLWSGRYGPSPILLSEAELANDHPVHSLSRTALRTSRPGNHRPLEDYEDLYYMVVLAIKHMHQQMKLRIDNGFLALDAVLHHAGRDPDGSKSAVAAADMVALLQEAWDVINNRSVLKALDGGARSLRLAHEVAHVRLALDPAAQRAPAAVEAHILALYDEFGVQRMQGIEWCNVWCAPAIGAFLSVKWFHLLQREQTHAVLSQKDVFGDQRAKHVAAGLRAVARAHAERLDGAAHKSTVQVRGKTSARRRGASGNRLIGNRCSGPAGEGPAEGGGAAVDAHSRELPSTAPAPAEN